MTAALEVSPASEWCQRWNGRSHSWRHRSEGGFNPDDYTVEAIDESTAKRFIVDHHYSGSYPAAKLRYGMFRDNELVGSLVIGVPTSSKVLTSVFPDLEPYVAAAEISRLCLFDRVAANGETWFMGQAFHEAAAVGIRGLVSFADPCPRRVNGRLIFPGHRGVIYLAKGATYTGRGTARTLLVLPDDSVLNARSQQKVRRQERGHEYVEQRLIRLGAQPIRAFENPATWLNDALATVGVTRIRHRGCHRYVFRLGNKAERRRVRIAPAPLPPPTEVDA